MYYKVPPHHIEQILAHWQGQPKETAYQLIYKYGLPNEATISRLIWYNNGYWKRTIVYRDTIPHNFPTPHPDFLEQVIDYEVPEGLFDEIARFDGSVYPDRTRGEVAAKCHKEAMNTLSLNLVNDIVIGKQSVAEARRFYAETAKAFQQGITSPYTERLLFPIPKNTADPDVAFFY